MDLGFTFSLTYSGQTMLSYLKNKLNLFHGYAHEFSWHLKQSNFISWFDVKHDILKPRKSGNTNARLGYGEVRRPQDSVFLSTSTTR